MINLTQAREAIAEIITAHCPMIKAVYPRAVNDIVEVTPAVVLASVINGRFNVEAVACPTSPVDEVELPVVVLVERDGLDEEATQLELEKSWIQVLEALRAHLDASLLGQVGISRSLTTLEAGSYQIGATEYPAQIITITILG